METGNSKIDILQNFLESETLVPNRARLKPSVPNFARCLINKIKSKEIV